MYINPKEFYSSFPTAAIAQGKMILDNDTPIKITDTSSESMMADVGKHSKHTVLLVNKAKYFSGDLELTTECECKRKKCQHAAALILYNLKHGNLIEQRNEVLNWLDDIAPQVNKENTQVTKPKKALSSFQVLYILDTKDQQLFVTLKLARPVKTGGFGADKDYVPDNKNHKSSLNHIDEKVTFNLAWKDSHHNQNRFQLNSNQDEELLKQIISTHRCFYQSKDNLPVSLGDPKDVSPKWEINQFGEQHITATANEDVQIFKIENLWYLFDNNILGEAITNVPSNIFRKILAAPPIPIDTIDTVKTRIQQICPEIPEPYSQEGNIEKLLEPTPCIHLSKAIVDVEERDVPRSRRHSYYYEPEISEEEISIAKVYYKYDNISVSAEESKPILYQLHDNILIKIPRNFEREVNDLNELKKDYQLECIEDIDHIDDHDDDIGQCFYIGDENESFEFSNKIIPKLKSEGWIVTAEKGYTIEVIHDDDIEWFSELEESEYDWFGLNLGVVIDGEKINVLPLIIRYLKTADIKAAKNLPPETKIPIQMSDGRTLMMPSHRLQGILNVLTELYDTEPLNADGNLVLSNLSASQLEELEKMINVDNFTWLGSEKIRKLGQKLKSFKKIKNVKVPSSFKATLRNYQQEGVNWLRFLNDFELGGVLADDMGLGKTIQTLACLVIEQKTKPEHPNLIVSPTSLVSNWLLETQKFAPDLKVLALHGSDRKQHFDNLDQYDVILTSYPLILRDEKILLEKNFNYIILDEAQFIKNHRAKATKVAFQLKAKHRLCLSGTPIENHLGELWSLFRFLAPGLLGTTKRFKSLYRTPIEKHSDAVRRKSLASRIKPFMLRRTKGEVAIDLPPKTEIIKTTALDPIQRDLYESIRLAMDQKVRDAISSQGLQKSHIIVLDALLKLRQTCCDPRILKIESAKAAHGHSAKLRLLMDLLPNMVEEGRKILLFSQFTSMIDLIKDELDQKNIQYVTLTGSTKDRLTPINQFQNGEVPVFIISLKAGGVGLNLTAADTIIHYDPWWNPAAENQATDRAHRIGQDKPVFVYKLITEGTVEETILEMQNRKKTIVEGLLSENANTKKPLKQEDLEELFKPLENVESIA